MDAYQEEIRRLILRRWMDENERSLAWVARRGGYTREYLSLVMNKHLPFSDKLARTLTERLGIHFAYREDPSPVNEESEEEEPHAYIAEALHHP
jgi:hypothetical protein